MRFRILLPTMDLVRTRAQLRKLLAYQAMVNALTAIGDDAIATLQAATPSGPSDGQGTPPGSDAPGRLRDSYVSTLEASYPFARVTVSTSQPTKLYYVTHGRGWVFPVNKRALYWPQLEHPVPYARPSQPNDFVTPALSAVRVAALATMAEAMSGAFEVP